MTRRVQTTKPVFVTIVNGWTIKQRGDLKYGGYFVALKDSPKGGVLCKTSTSLSYIKRACK
jgi:hypothetical protein